ncbi:MAG: hypothetical protein IKT60_03445, partial [Clostridia bacterium]|nr:hypothetical protein [Clostridia bacterium]
MKKFIALALAIVMVLSLAACGTEPSSSEPASSSSEVDNGVMTYAEYDAAALESEVVIEAYVQATQSWWENKITV